jgi:hypothetical protein
MASREEIDALLRSQAGRFYVYLLSLPDGTPIYIGKGVGRRIFAHERDAAGPGLSHKLNSIRKVLRSGGSIGYSILAFYDCERECHAREVAEISRIGRHDLGTGPLTNLTSGGEGTVGLSEETLARIDAELHGPNAPGDRGVANRFYLQLASSVSSVPIRPISASTPRPLAPFAGSKAPTSRMAAALAASAIANAVLLIPGARIPRRATVDGVECAIEFGASKNLMQAGMAELDASGSAGREVFKLSERGWRSLAKLLDQRLLVSAGVLEP